MMAAHPYLTATLISFVFVCGLVAICWLSDYLR